MFWEKNHADSLTHAFFLSASHRSQDPFLNAFLREARDGELSWTMYNFIHGFATVVPGSWLPAADTMKNGRKGILQCGSSHCQQLWEETWPRRFRAGASSQELLDMECLVCQKERQRRNRLLRPDSTAHLSKDFVAAPYVHPFNAPKSRVFQLRALAFAQAHCRQLLWVTAVDIPLSRDDETRSVESLREARTRWLQYTEAKTAGIVGILPLCAELPLRFTDNVDVARGACKHSTGTLVGWQLSESDRNAKETACEAEVALRELPLHLFIRIDDATWMCVAELGVGVLAVKAASRYWERAPGASVKRTGFPIVPNFSGAEHSYTGATLDAAIVDLLDQGRTSRRQEVPQSYVGISRVREAGRLLLAQAFAPCLFRMGPQPGPHLLLQWLSGK